ncbi:hypothetical protein H2199_005296 [Coniosporium tulheliwenetii]|uniref:Uncharacterized protein n=1 Tax=Coniosporium tulheliwenetii TaxID=3383036 RepID=A0ACC2Z180_9PEZI|nr:hypothetical protein H2199_005296 [Cladosporium sp. JES 115]
MIGRIGKGDILSGIPGSITGHDEMPFSLTEEFVSVYRMHSLIPDNIAFFDSETSDHKKTTPIEGVVFGKARDLLADGTLTWSNAFYSFGINYPGAITIRNHPKFLRDLSTPNGRHLDIATVDILRDRERGVPRYNEFRRLFHLKPAKTFSKLCGGNEALAADVASVYGNDIKKIDLLVGCLCEPLPKGFGFSDTAFRVFILMATRRLKSDRFIATEWKPKMYTKSGLKWIQDSTMKDVLGRHFPELKVVLKDVKNAFALWPKVGKAGMYNGPETNA